MSIDDFDSVYNILSILLGAFMHNRNRIVETLMLYLCDYFSIIDRSLWVALLRMRKSRAPMP